MGDSGKGGDTDGSGAVLDFVQSRTRSDPPSSRSCGGRCRCFSSAPLFAHLSQTPRPPSAAHLFTMPDGTTIMIKNYRYRTRNRRYCTRKQIDSIALNATGARIVRLKAAGSASTRRVNACKLAAASGRHSLTGFGRCVPLVRGPSLDDTPSDRRIGSPTSL